MQFLMHLIRLLKISIIHLPTLIVRVLTLLFRKNNKLEFTYSLKYNEYKNLSLSENHIRLNINVKNGLLLKINNHLIPLSRDFSKMSFLIPLTQNTNKLQLKAIGLFQKNRALEMIDKKGVNLSIPIITNKDLFKTTKIQEINPVINLQTEIKLSSVNSIKNNDEPLLINIRNKEFRKVIINPISEPSFELDTNNIELKLNQKT